MGRVCAVRGCGKIPDRRTCHRLPLRYSSRLKLWLSFLGFDTNTPIHVLEEADHRVCALHFRFEDYVQSTKNSKRVQSPKKLYLKRTAVPTLLGPPQDEENIGAVGGVDASTTQPVHFSTPEKDWPSSSSGLSFILTSPEPTPDQPKTSRRSLSGKYLALPVVRDSPAVIPDETDTEMHLMDVSMSTAPEDDPKDYSYHLSQQSTQSSSSATSSSSASDIRSGWNENKWIVNESCLMALFSTCQVPTCGVPIIEKKKSTRGSKIKIEWTCLKNHSGSWMSCPEVRGIPENNLLISAATLFSGTTYTEIAEWASILHLQILKTSQFYCIQRDNLIPVIHFAYKDQQDYLIKRLVREKELGKSIELCGDARCDSPGYSSKYSTYSLQLLSTQEIVHFELLQVTEAGSSVAMESQGFRRGLNHLIYNVGLPIDLIATDRAPSVRKIMREEYQNIRHEFDTWHVAKGLQKKLLALANKKGNQDLGGWLQAILNHFWFCCSSSDGNAEELKRRWTSLLYHIRGVHTWEQDGRRWACPHPPLSSDEQKMKRWLREDSDAFKGLQTIVEEKRLLKDLDHMTHFKHTGSLEVYHSMMLKYMPKRLHFDYNTMVARTQLAILDNNYNVGREQATTSEGTPRFSVVFPKRTKDWVAKKIYQPTSQNFTHHLVERVLQRREDPTPKEMPRVQQPKTIATKEKPPKEDVIRKHQSRFPHNPETL
ncbi:uncharacterized protein LOC134445044 isoform X2 [Engraulis encrasicolus]|uniref:uncharacterized protein LOC134443760 isoform X2 n=1 Tax=Engraulis encrasicolus TaxID=184585 RepID=UPI002FD6A80C